MTRKFLQEKNLISIFACQSIWRITQHNWHLKLRYKIAEPLQGGAHESGTRHTVIFKHPLFGNRQPVCPRILLQRRRLAGNRVLLLLLVRGDPRVDRRFHYHFLSLLTSGAAAPRGDRLEPGGGRPTGRKRIPTPLVDQPLGGPVDVLSKSSSSASATRELKVRCCLRAQALRRWTSAPESLTVRTCLGPGTFIGPRSRARST